MRRFFLATAALVAFGAALPHAQAQTLRIALREDPDVLDPTLARTYVGRIVFTALCDKLVDIDEKLAFVPQLATEWHWESPTALVMKLRPGVLFQDGEKMDAEAVRYSMERHLTMQGSYRRSEISVLDRVEVVDPLTVRMVLKQPSSPFLAQLADRAGMIVSPKAAEAAGRDFSRHPVCAGPFKFAERVPQDRIVLDRFDGYWNRDAIKLDRVVYLPITDSSIRLANLQAGSIDITEQVLAPDVDAVRKNPKLRIASSEVLGYQSISFNLGNGPRSAGPLGRDARVRRAFELSLDRDAINQVVYAGLYAPDAQAVPDSSPFHFAYKPPARDVAKAKALLKEAGVATPFVVNLMTGPTPDARQVAEVIQSMAAEAGFDVKITVVEFASSLQASSRGDFEAYYINWSGRVDADGNLYSFLRSDGALNDGKYANPKVDAALDEARSVTDVAQRRDIYARMWQQVSADVPLIYLWHAQNLVGLSAAVQGFRSISDGMIRLQGLSLAK